MNSDRQIEIRCLVLDVDGVLTDGGIYVNDLGHFGRRFDVQDGFAIRWFQKLGGVVAICSGKTSAAVAARAKELGIEHVLQGSRDKLADVCSLLDRLGLTLDHVAAIGDDLPDLPLLMNVAFPVAVANAADEVKAIAQLVTTRPGGQGAVREAIEYLMRASERWTEVVAYYAAQADTE